MIRHYRLKRLGPGPIRDCSFQQHGRHQVGIRIDINDYCRCDVLDTYFVFLRSAVLLGKLTLDQEQTIVAETKQWLEERAEEVPAYRTYLTQWGDWQNPWDVPEPEAVNVEPAQ